MKVLREWKRNTDSMSCRKGWSTNLPTNLLFLTTPLTIRKKKTYTFWNSWGFFILTHWNGDSYILYSIILS